MRVKGGTTRHNRHKKLRQLAKGFRGFRRRTVKGAQEGLRHALSHAYIGRKLKKRDFRQLWIIRLNAALHDQGLSYSKFMHILKSKQVVLDRKVLSQIAYQQEGLFANIVRSITETHLDKRD